MHVATFRFNENPFMAMNIVEFFRSRVWWKRWWSPLENRRSMRLRWEIVCHITCERKKGCKMWVDLLLGEEYHVGLQTRTDPLRNGSEKSVVLVGISLSPLLLCRPARVEERAREWRSRGHSSSSGVTADESGIMRSDLLVKREGGRDT